MQRLRIAIDPLLRETCGPEIAWTWRLLLSGMGYAWEEVALAEAPCDIAYVIAPERAGPARLIICAEPQRWRRRSLYRLAGVGRNNGWQYPVYSEESGDEAAVFALDDSLVYPRDIIFDVFWLATGQEEAHWPKNKHGYVDITGTPTEREQALRLALASGIGVGLQRTLADLGYAEPLPRWPYGKRAAAGVGHDVDYPEVIRWLEPLRILRRQGASGVAPAAAVAAGSRHHWHFASWVEMEKRLNTRSAFYFVARTGSLLEYAAGTPDSFYDVRSRRFQQLFRYLAEEGFEIGLHASYRACESREQFAAEKQILEAASGQPVRGNRHHYWHLNPLDPEETLLLHEQVGFSYDTSLVHDRYAGWRRGLAWPFFPFLQNERRELQTLQLPTAWMDDQVFGHRAYNAGDRQELLRSLVDCTAEQGGCMLIDVHEYVYDERLFPEWAQTYRELWEYLVARSDVWIDTPCRIADYWIARYKTIQRASRGLTTERNAV
jgi:hypothetical protein